MTSAARPGWWALVMRLPDPRTSWLLVVGSSTYDARGGLPPLPGVSGNLNAILRTLTSPDGTGIPEEHAEVLHNPDEPSMIEEALLECADRRADTLIFYYAGHGLLDETGDLHLATRRSSIHRPQLRSLPYLSVRRAIASSRAKNRIVILDCCYSGRAISAMGAGMISGGDVEVAGTYILTSTSANRTAHAPVGESLTAFTGALVDVLEQGEPGGSEMLDLLTLHRGVTRRLGAAGRPAPKQQGTDTVSGLALARNRAYKRVAPPVSARGPRATEVPNHVIDVSAQRIRDAGGRVVGLTFVGSEGLLAAVSSSASVVEAEQQGERKRRSRALSSTRRAGRAVVGKVPGAETGRLAYWADPDAPRWESGPIPRPSTSGEQNLGVAPGLRAAFVLSARGCFEWELGSVADRAVNRTGVLDAILSGGSGYRRRILDTASEPVRLVVFNQSRAVLAADAVTELVASGALASSGVPEIGAMLANLRQVALTVYDLRTGECLKNIALPVGYRNILAVEGLPGHLVAITSHSRDDQRPIRTTLVDTTKGIVVRDELVSGVAARRIALTTAGLPHFRVSTDGLHLASATRRTDRTVIYSVQGTGVVSNMPGSRIAWSPIAAVLACISERELTLYDVGSSTSLASCSIPDLPTGDPVFSRNGRHIAVPLGEAVATFELTK